MTDVGYIGGELPSDAKTTPSDLDTLYPFYTGFDVDSDNKITTAYVCFARNNTKYCLKGADPEAYETNKLIIEEAFKDVENTCSFDFSARCHDDVMTVAASSGGDLEAFGSESDAYCGVFMIDNEVDFHCDSWWE